MKRTLHPTREYWKFICKYLIKKKSTWLPLVAFALIFIFFSILIQTLFTNPVFASQKLEAFKVITVFTSMLFFAFIGVMKAINLFSEPIEEGLDLLVVSKPIHRGQILFVKFLAFFSLSLIFLVLNTIVFLICSLIIEVEAADYLLVSLGFSFGNWLAFIIFGNLAILLATKFGTKTIFALTIVAGGFFNALNITFRTFGPALITGKADAFNQEIKKPEQEELNDVVIKVVKDQQKQNQFFLIHRQLKRYNSNRNINFESLASNLQANQIANIWNRGADSWWIYQMNLYLNPLSAFEKIGLFNTWDPLIQDALGQSYINQFDFTWRAQINPAFSYWYENQTNYSLTGFDFVTARKNQAIEIGQEPNPNGNWSYFQTKKDDEELNEQIIQAIRSHVPKILELVNQQLANVISKEQSFAILKQVIETNPDFGQAFFDQFKDLVYVTLTNGQISINNNWINQITIKTELLYYLSHLVAINEYYTLKGQVEQINQNNFKQQLVQALVDFDQPMAKPVTFFGDDLKTKISFSQKVMAVQLIPETRTFFWALIFQWSVLTVLFTLATILLYKHLDFK